MSIALALLLGLVQGITEFLPISSSGHLRLISAAFGVQGAQTLFDVCVHSGTLVAVLAYYRNEVWSMIASLANPSWDNPRFRLSVLVIVGTIPAAVIGIGFGELMEGDLATVPAVGGFLLLNGVILMQARGDTGEGRSIDELTLMDAILVGSAQCIALFRGVSRSGTTIVAALKRGISREAAATFSFLLSIPVIGGAVILEVGKALSQGGVSATPLVAGTLVAGVSGYAALVLLVRLVKNGHLHRFAWYCWAVGAFALAASFLT